MAADVSNYYLGKGILTWTPKGGSATARDLGNVPEFELTLRSKSSTTSRRVKVSVRRTSR